MRSAAVDEDLTTRARIRDAAIALMGRSGFAATSVRAIAAEVGVSPALLLHHFGSKEGLRQACDDHVTQVFADETERLTDANTPTLVASMLDRRPEFSDMALYIRQALMDGSAFGARIFDSLVADTQRYLARIGERGELQPYDDEPGLAMALVVMSLGSQLLAPYIAPPGTPDEGKIFAAGDRLTLPLLHLLTHGLYADSRLLDLYLEYQARRSETTVRPT